MAIDGDIVNLLIIVGVLMLIWAIYAVVTSEKEKVWTLADEFKRMGRGPWNLLLPFLFFFVRWFIMDIFEILDEFVYDILMACRKLYQTNEGGTLIRIVLLLVFLYFIYTKVKTRRYY